MALKLTQKDLAQVRANIQALRSTNIEAKNRALKELREWLHESPEHHVPHFLQLCPNRATEEQKHLMGAIVGEVVSVKAIPLLAHFGRQYSSRGTIARYAIQHWSERASVSEVAQGFYTCLDTSLSLSKSPLLDFTLGLLTEHISQEPDAAFWPVVRKLRSKEVRKYHAAVHTGKYLADLLPTVDLPRPSAGSHSSNANLPTPAENGVADKNDLPTPALAPKMQIHRSWWRRWIR